MVFAVRITRSAYTHYSKMPRGLMLQQVAHIITIVVHSEEDIFVPRLDWICGTAFSPGM